VVAYLALKVDLTQVLMMSFGVAIYRGPYHKVNN
jgi:hypothetical protein